MNEYNYVQVKIFLYLQRSDESEENAELTKSTEEEPVNGGEKGRKENGRTEEQPSKKRKEDSSLHHDVKKPSPEKKKVSTHVQCMKHHEQCHHLLLKLNHLNYF